MEYIMEIASNEDFDLIEDCEEREEMQEKFEDEIETIYQYMVKEKIEFDQIDDTRFNITIEGETEIITERKMLQLAEDIQGILSIDDIAYLILEEYEEA